MIKANARKYSISALCRCLGIARSTYYYECHDPRDESSLEEAIQTAYDENRRVYGQRKADAIGAFMFAISEQDALTDFDAGLWTAIIRSVTVHSDGRMAFHFLAGADIEG